MSRLAFATLVTFCLLLPSDQGRAQSTSTAGYVVTIAGVGELRGTLPASQLTDVLSAKWRDGEIRSQAIPSTGETEISLGLLPSGPRGTLTLVLSARVRQRVPAEPPASVHLFVGAGLNVNPNAIRRPVLRFVLDANSPKSVTIDASDRLGILDLDPSSSLDNVSAAITFVEFVQLLRADVITAEILGLNVSLTRKQRDALRDFGMRVIKPAR